MKRQPGRLVCLLACGAIFLLAGRGRSREGDPSRLGPVSSAVAGIGCVTYADANVAVGYQQGERPSVGVATPRTLGEMAVEVIDRGKIAVQKTGTLSPG